MSIVFTISGPYGSGKSSVVNLACKLLGGLNLAIPYTTRTPNLVDSRESEFFFTSHEAFESMIARDVFLEYVSISGNYYGTPRNYLEQARENGQDLVIQVDETGVAQIKQKIPSAVSILVLPEQSARETLAFDIATKAKLPSLLQEVFLPSIQEVLLNHQTSNPDKYDHVIVNDRLEDAANKVIEIIRSERLRRALKNDLNYV